MERRTSIESRLAELDRKIAEKTDELEQKGILRGEMRAKAAELRAEHRRLATLAEEHAKGAKNAAATAVVAAEAETLRAIFDKWVAEIDRGY